LATTILIERMGPIAIVHHKPERILIELAEIGNDCDSYLLDTLLMQCTCKMMVINDVMPVLWAKDHGYQVFTEKFFTFLSTFITPMLAFGLNLTHADGNLGWTQVQYGDGLKTRFTDSGHVRFLPREFANFEAKNPAEIKVSKPLDVGPIKTPA